MAGTATEGLPSGIVTFVFTDIEGSTRLFSRIGDAYVGIKDRHDEILRSVWSRRGGHVVDAEGDQFFVAFSDTGDAIVACADVHRALAAEPWPDDITLRVRAGIHRGLASPHDGGYVALAVHQAARVIGAAHGGQTLVSEQAADGTNPGHGLTLRPLGRFRVRDFPDPVRLYQVVGEGLLEELPAIRAIPADGHNIVHPTNPTVGRAEAIAGIAARIVAGRTVTLIGPGGVGKSRLAAEVGIAIAPSWSDGVWLVDLSGVSEPELVAGAVAGAIGAPTGSGGPRLDDVVRHLETRHAVVILDNCEQVVDACRTLIGALLDAAEGVAVVATSREPLHAAGEHLWPVEALATVGQTEHDPAAVMASPSERLFWERAVAVRPDFAIDERNADVIAEICRHLDGIPLLIELAAAHVAHQSLQEIRSGLEGRLRVLRSRDPRLSDRHRDVDDLLDWSYRLLDDDEAAALRRLSMFATSFSRETAGVAVAADDIDPEDVPDLLWSLVDRSLVAADVADTGTRYRLLEAVRSYAHRNLEERGEVEEVATRLARWYMDQAGPWLPQDRDWVDRVDVELDNLRALIPEVSAEEPELAQQIACSIGRHHDAQQNFAEGIAELTRLTRTLDHKSTTRVSMLTTLAYMLARTGQVERAEEVVGEAKDLRDEHGAPEWDDVGIERVAGDIARRSGDLERAIEIARTTLSGPLSERGQARMHNLLGISAAGLGDLETAYDAFLHELELNEGLGLGVFVASAHGNLAEIASRRGETAQAAAHQQACLDLAIEQGSPAMLGFSLIVAAQIAAEREGWGVASELQSRAEELLEEIGLALYPDDEQKSAELMDQARAHLGETGFDEAWQRGRVMDIEEAVDQARRVLSGAAGDMPGA